MNANTLEHDSDRRMWFALLGVFTLWLIVQNAVLMTIVSVLHPDLAVGLAVDAVRAVAHMIASSSHAVASLASGAPGWLSSGVLTTLNGGLL